MDKDPAPAYQDACLYAGQLYLESRHQLEVLTRKLARAEAERDEALRLVRDRPKGE